MRERVARRRATQQALDRRRVVGPLEEKLGELARAVAVLDGLRETPELERRHRRVTVQLDRPLIALQPCLVRLERLRELTSLERGVPSLARAVRGLSLPDLPLVPGVDIGFHRLERRVIGSVLHPRVILVVRGRPQVPARVIRRRSSLRGDVGGIRSVVHLFREVLGVQLPSPLAPFLLAHHLSHLLANLALLLLREVLVLVLLRLLLRLFRARLLLRRLLVLLPQDAIDVLGAHLAAAQAIHQARHVLHLLEEGLGLVRTRRQRALPEPGDLVRRDRHRAGASRQPKSDSKPNRSARFTSPRLSLTAVSLRLDNFKVMAGFGHPPLLALLWAHSSQASFASRPPFPRARTRGADRPEPARSDSRHARDLRRSRVRLRARFLARARRDAAVPPRVRREMKTRAPALRRAAQKPLPQAPAPAAKPAPRRAATMRKKAKAEACRMKAADRRRCVPGALSGRAARQFSPIHPLAFRNVRQPRRRAI